MEWKDRVEALRIKESAGEGRTIGWGELALKVGCTSDTLLRIRKGAIPSRRIAKLITKRESRN